VIAREVAVIAVLVPGTVSAAIAALHQNGNDAAMIRVKKTGDVKKDKDKDVSDKSKDKASENSDKNDGISKTNSSSPDIKEVKSDGTDISQKKSEFFDSCLGKLFYDLGMNLVQETVQIDLLTEQQRRARKDKSATVMHAIMSLKVNIEQSKERNQAFQMELKKCRFCSFRTESQAVLDHHMETPHMKGTNYRCNVCKMETRTAQEVTSHMFVEHGVRARLERAAAIHQCPQCPFEDNQKGKLTRHIASVNEKKRHYSCNLCDGTFTSNQHLKGHISSVHDGLKPHSCDMCNASFARKSHLKRHKDKVHGEKDHNITLDGLPETSGFDEMPLESSMVEFYDGQI